MKKQIVVESWAFGAALLAAPGAVGQANQIDAINENVVGWTTKVESKAAEDAAKMVFHRYGDYLLSRGTVGRG